MGGQHPDWLPSGWKVSVKIRSCGRKDKYYINPSNGLKFNSKLEVLRYLESSEKDQKPKERNKIEIKKTRAEKLPPGWIKEIRTKKNGGKMRSDPCYIDPVSGRHFRSMLEVLRYLESKNSEKIESSAEAKYKKEDSNLNRDETINSEMKHSAGSKRAMTNKVLITEDNHLEKREGDDSLVTELSDKLQLIKEEKQQADKMEDVKKLAGDKLYKSADGDKRLRSGRKVASLEKVNKSEVEKREREDDSVEGKLPYKPPQLNGMEKCKYERRRSTRLADSKLEDNVTKDQSLESGSEGVVEKNINISVTNDIEQRGEESNTVEEGPQHGKVTYQRKRKSSISKLTTDLPRRTSKRLARVEVDSSLEVKTDKITGEDTIKNLGKSGWSDGPKIDDTGKKSERLEDSNINNQKRTVNQENLSSLENHEKEHEKSIDSPLDGLLLDPCIEFAIKTLTGAIPIEDVYKAGGSPVSSLASPNQTSASTSKLASGDIWADPCFEFAVKTLTGETPKEDKLTLPKFRLDNVSPLSYSINQLDCVDVKKSFLSVKDPPFPPRAVNGSSQSFVGSSIRHGVERRMGNVKFL